MAVSSACFGFAVCCAHCAIAVCGACFAIAACSGCLRLCFQMTDAKVFSASWIVFLFHATKKKLNGPAPVCNRTSRVSVVTPTAGTFERGLVFWAIRGRAVLRGALARGGEGGEAWKEEEEGRGRRTAENRFLRCAPENKRFPLEPQSGAARPLITGQMCSRWAP